MLLDFVTHNLSPASQNRKSDILVGFSKIIFNETFSLVHIEIILFLMWQFFIA